MNEQAEWNWVPCLKQMYLIIGALFPNKVAKIHLQ